MKHKETYDRMAVGIRLQNRRKQLGWSRRYVSGRIGVVEKYYSDIERGICGMSVGTLMSLSRIYGFSMDDLIYGKQNEDGNPTVDRTAFLFSSIGRLPKQAQDCCMQMLFLFMEGVGVQEAQKSVRNETGSRGGRNV